jgi:hypothetical protein
VPLSVNELGLLDLIKLHIASEWYIFIRLLPVYAIILVFALVVLGMKKKRKQ